MTVLSHSGQDVKKIGEEHAAADDPPQPPVRSDDAEDDGQVEGHDELHDAQHICEDADRGEDVPAAVVGDDEGGVMVEGSREVIECRFRGVREDGAACRRVVGVIGGDGVEEGLWGAEEGDGGVEGQEGLDVEDGEAVDEGDGVLSLLLLVLLLL